MIVDLHAVKKQHRAIPIQFIYFPQWWYLIELPYSIKTSILALILIYWFPQFYLYHCVYLYVFSFVHFQYTYQFVYPSFQSKYRQCITTSILSFYNHIPTRNQYLKQVF